MRPCAAEAEGADEVGHGFPGISSEGVGIAAPDESHAADEETGG